MSTDKKTNPIKKLVGLISIASTGIFLSLPALALTNSSINSANFNARSRHLLAQNTPGAGTTGINGTGGGQQNNGGFGTNGTGVNQPANGGFGTNGTGVNQPANGGFGTNGTGINQPANGGFGTNGTGVNQPANGGFGTNGTGINQPANGGFGTNGTGINQPANGGFGTNGTGINQPANGGFGTNGRGVNQPNNGGTGIRETTPGNQQSNVQQGSFEQLMRFGYAATQQRDYATALSYFQRANQLRPNNPYAIRAIRNVSGYIQRDAQGGASNAPTNQGMR